MQTVFDDLSFSIELSLVSQLLKVTATTPAKVRTRRLKALRRRLDDFDDRGEADCSLLSIDLHAKAIARRRERDHHGLAVRMSEAQASGEDSFNGDFHDRSSLDCRGFTVAGSGLSTLPGGAGFC